MPLEHPKSGQKIENWAQSLAQVGKEQKGGKNEKVEQKNQIREHFSECDKFSVGGIEKFRLTGPNG